MAAAVHRRSAADHRAGYQLRQRRDTAQAVPGGQRHRLSVGFYDRRGCTARGFSEITGTGVMRIAMPLHAVYYSDQTVSTRIRCFIDFLSEKLAKADK